MSRTSRSRLLATILTLSLTLVGLSLVTHGASAAQVRKTPATTGVGGGGSFNGDPDGPGGMLSGGGGSGPSGLPRWNLQATGTRTPGEGAAASKSGWWYALRMLLTQWGVTLVR